MTYALAWPLQEAIFALLTGTPSVRDLAGDRIHDAPPSAGTADAPDGLYVTLGDEEAQSWFDGTGGGASHLVTLSVHAPRRGFAEAKQLAGAISDALLAGPIQPSRGHVVDSRFVSAATRRAEGDALRRIDLRFRIVIEDTA